MGAQKSRFEAATVAFTRIGSGYKNKSFLIDKEYQLARHRDGPNDNDNAYDITIVFWCLLVRGKDVYRLTVIFYSRLKIRTALNREMKWMAPVRKDLENYRAKAGEYRQLCLETLGSQENYQMGTGCGMALYKTLSTGNPNGYYSGFVSMMDTLYEEYKFTHTRYVELFYLACQSNCAPYFVYILQRWLPNGPNPLRIVASDRHKQFSRRVEGPNFIQRFKQECNRIGLSPVNGKYTRYQTTNPQIYDLSSELIRKEIDNFERALEMANEGASYNETLDFLKQSCDNCGGVTTLSFYSLGVLSGLLHTEEARLQSLWGEVSPHSAFAKELEKRGCPKDWYARTLKRLAFMLEIELYVAENLGCKCYRRLTCWDTYTLDQWLYDRRLENRGGRKVVLLYRKRLDDEEWAPYNPAKSREFFD